MYGSADHVAKLVPQHATPAGRFDESTTPSLATVEAELEQTSALLDVMLASLGFDTPVTNSTAALMLDGFVNKTVAEVVKAIRGGGRFGPGVKEGRKTLVGYVMEEVRSFVESVAEGLEGVGVSRSMDPLTGGFSYRATDERGYSVSPLFQRAEFGDLFRGDADS